MTEAGAVKARVEAFIRFLCESEIVDEASARQSYEQIGRVDLRVGRVALMEGFITPEEINKILWAQRELTDKKFGEVAVAMGIMTEEEVRRTLELQDDELFVFCQSMILDGLVAPQTLFALLRGFLERNFDRTVEYKRIEKDTKVSKTVRDALKKITVVAPMPSSVSRLIQMLNDPEVDLEQVANVISMDVGLTAMLLRLSNSAFYGQKSHVTSVARAVSMIGTKKLRQLILSAAIMDNFKNLSRDRVSAFWQDSMRAAQWCKELSQFSGKTDIDEFFLAGFLHNIGELILLQHFPMEYRKILQLMKEGKPRLEAERAVMGCDHADIGSYLFSLWQLPTAVIQATMLQYHPRLLLMQMPGVLPEVKVVNMAVAILACDESVNAFGQGMHLGQVVEDYSSIIPIRYEKAMEMRDRVETTVAELMRWFTV